jgi:hypothetical protein
MSQIIAGDVKAGDTLLVPASAGNSLYNLMRGAMGGQATSVQMTAPVRR